SQPGHGIKIPAGWWVSQSNLDKLPPLTREARLGRQRKLAFSAESIDMTKTDSEHLCVKRSPMPEPMQTWKELAAQPRGDSMRCTAAAGSGHPTSSMSAADLMAVLLTKYFRYDWSKPRYGNNDRLIFSKGHAAPLLYAMFKAAGAITDQELMSLRKFGSRLEGHPNPHVLPYVDVATGSLGQGLPIGVGMAINGAYLDKLPYHVWVLLGDSEVAEGSIWEAFDKASYYKLDRLIAILDMNRLGQRGETEWGWDSPLYAARARAFGWHAI